MTDWATEIGETPQQAYERGRVDEREAFNVFIEEAYESGRIDEWKRIREHLGDVLSGLLAQYGEISRALEGSMLQLAAVEHARRLRYERRQMILKCREIAQAMGRPAGYVFSGVPVQRLGDNGPLVAVTPIGIDSNGDWINDERQTPSDGRRHRQQREVRAAHDRPREAERRAIGSGQQRDIGGSPLATRQERPSRVNARPGTH